MQTIVDKVMRVLTVRHPVAGKNAEFAHQEAPAFAAELLENYKKQLARGPRRIKHRQESSRTDHDPES
jgi:hypothetical protein